MATEQDDVIAEPKAATLSSVGSTLKAARERMGKEISEVASQLRIRQPYLAALEDGRHKDLPGGTYAVGFLRTYADYLTLDGEEMVRRFKQEAAGDLDSRAELIFPSPVTEGRVPGGALLFLGLVLAGATYGGWYWLSSRDATVAELVPPIPERLAPATRPPAPVAVTATPKPDEDSAEPKSPEALKPGEVVPPAEAEDDKLPAAPLPSEPAKAPETKPAQSKPTEAKLAQSKPAEEKPAQAEPEATPVDQAVSAAPSNAEPKIIGQDNAGSRISLKAASDDCWVQVRELDGQLLLSRLLRKGDSYMVPNRPGLTLMVGNAGALEISVDGKTVPALGASGQVRRDIKLDPDKLTSG